MKNLVLSGIRDTIVLALWGSGMKASTVRKDENDFRGETIKVTVVLSDSMLCMEGVDSGMKVAFGEDTQVVVEAESGAKLV